MMHRMLIVISNIYIVKHSVILVVGYAIFVMMIKIIIHHQRIILKRQFDLK